jgi:hypothetical protein
MEEIFGNPASDEDKLNAEIIKIELEASKSLPEGWCGDGGPEALAELLHK